MLFSEAPRYRSETGASRSVATARKKKAARFRAASSAAFGARFRVRYGVAGCCIVPDEPPGPPMGPLVPPVPVALVSVGPPPGRDVSVPVEVPVPEGLVPDGPVSDEPAPGAGCGVVGAGCGVVPEPPMFVLPEPGAAPPAA